MRIAVLATAVSSAVVSLALADPATAAIKTSTNIAPQELASALRVLAADRHLQILYTTQIVANRQTSGAVGEFTVEEALARLLGGTGLAFRYIDDDTITIVPHSDIPSTSRSLEGSGPVGEGSTSAGEERKSFWSRLRLAQSDSPSSSQGASQGEDQVSAQSQGRVELEEILVTGSRLKRPDAEGPSPVVVISREEIDRSGAATTRELLNAISQNSISMDESGNSMILGASTVQLRGLPFGTTLMLLNGRRLGASAATVSGNFFDLNNIPLGAVERIEILTDSASAVYGADAIGGAVNVILRQDYDGLGAAVRVGTSAEGDATERNASLTLGGGGDAFSGLLVLDVFDRDPLYAAARDLTSTYDFRRFGGSDTRSTYSYPANVYSLAVDPVSGAPLPLPGLTSTFAAVPRGTDGTGLTIADFQATQGTHNLFDPAPYASLMAEAKRQTAFGSARYTASPKLQFFGEALVTHRDQVVGSPPADIPFGEFGQVVVPAANPFNPFGVDVGVDYRFTELGRTARDSTTDFSRFVVGAEGALFERFDWQVYLLADREHTDIVNRGAVDLDAVQDSLLEDTDPQTALNLFSTTGNNNPATLAGILGETTDDLTAQAQMAEAMVRGPLFNLPAGALRFALGVNVRREEVDFRSPSLANVLADRDSDAAFAEFSVPLVGAHQQVPGIHTLELTAAIRHDRYDDIESLSSTNPQFGLVWRPIPSLLLRTSYGEAFKAPTVFNLFLPRVSFPAAAFDPLRGGELAFFDAFFAGNPELEPEEGKSLTAGFVWQPTFAPGFSVSLNAFRLKQENFITTLGIDQLINNVDQFPGRVERAPPQASDPPGFAGQIISLNLSNVNFGRLTVEGADVQLQYAFPRTAIGEFTTSLSGTYIDEYEIVLVPGAEPTNEVNHASEAGYPKRFKGNAGVSWSGLGGWSASATARYLTSYTDYDGTRQLPSQTWFDAQLGYRFGERSNAAWLEQLEATLGVNNLTDNQGDFSNTFAGYDAQQADIRGRFCYLSLKLKF